ncbi:DMT family transporter [Paenibacillus sp. MBLB4367]|uniref:DMT family transporter n=1 Tax=Paenibacillus sp. MBLB4367 TaxID=3384767 RepID=UPI003907F39C
MSWLFLVFAGLGEVVGVIGIQKVNEKRSWKSFGVLIGGFAVSFLLLSLAMNEIPMGTAYAVWTGIGTAGGALAGMLLFGEPKQWVRVLFIAMILSSAIGLKLLA